MRLAALILAVSAAASAADTLQERFAVGLRAQKAGDLDTAMSAYRGILNQNSRATGARYMLGICELQRGRLPEGIRQLEQVRREDPNHRQAAYTLVSTYVAISDLDAAKRILETNLRGDLSAESYFMRGSHSMARGDYAAAVFALEAALKLGPKLPGVHSMLGVTLCLANRLDDAIPVLESALQENPQDNNAAAFLGWLYKERDRPGEALALLSQTVAARPDDHGALFLLAQLTQARGEPTAAVAMLEKVVAAEPEHRGAHVLLARLYQQLRRPEDAARERATIVRLNREMQAAQPVR